MTALSPARAAALSLVSRRRRQDGRIRDMARDDKRLAALSPADRALAMRLALGVTAAAAGLNEIIDARLSRQRGLEPRVRDALLISAFEICYLDTPSAVAASQGVELVRSVSPRAAGLANAVLRRLAREVRPQVLAARERCERAEASASDLALVSGAPSWLVELVARGRGASFATNLFAAQLEPAPVYVAANGLRHTASSLEAALTSAGMRPCALDGLPGSFELGDAAPLAASGMVDQADLVVADLSAQLVCRIAAPAESAEMLEVGQGRGTKSLLLATALDAVHPAHIAAVDSVAYKVKLARKRCQTAGVGEVVRCYELDGCALAGPDVPADLRGPFASVLVDAPCSGTGTMRRHPEIAAQLCEADIAELADLQLRLLCAVATRVERGGSLTYATCSVLPQEDERVVEAFLATAEGEGFVVTPVCDAPACKANPELARLVSGWQTAEGYLLTMPAVGAGDGRFAARLVRAR